MSNFVDILIYVAIIIAAGIFKAVCEAINNHIGTFPIKGYFWQKNLGPIIPHTKYRWNAWHLSNSLFQMSVLALPFFYHKIIWAPLDYCLSGAVLIVVFNYFYNKVLVKKVTI